MPHVHIGDNQGKMSNIRDGLEFRLKYISAGEGEEGYKLPKGE